MKRLIKSLMWTEHTEYDEYQKRQLSTVVRYQHNNTLGKISSNYRYRKKSPKISIYFSISHTPTSYIIHWNSFCIRQSAEVREMFMFEIWIFFLQKNMDLLQEAFIHSQELCEARFIMDSRTLFNVLWTVVQKHPLTAMLRLRRARTIFYITPIRFFWKRKAIYI